MTISAIEQARRAGGIALIASAAWGLVACRANSPNLARMDLAGQDQAFAVDASRAAPSCTPRLAPPQIPPGWEEYTDWSCDCRFYVPKTARPAPIVWEPCAAGGLPNGVACQWMTVNWTTSDPGPIGASPRGWVDPEGRVFLRFTRFDTATPNPSVEYVVAEADGPAHTAIIAPMNSHTGCAILDYSDMREWRVAWFVAGDSEGGDISKTKHHGAIGGDIDAPHPPVLFHIVDSFHYNFSVSESWLGVFSTAGSTMTLYSWDNLTSGIRIASAPTDPEQFAPSTLRLYGSSAFWQLNSLTRVAIMAWDATRGSHALLRWNGDSTQGAWDLGTDGQQMVWTYGQNRSPTAFATDPFPTRSVMVSPFTTDPDAIRARRLRSDPSWGYMQPYAVGCGYAARGSNTADLLVVRLSDGVSWTLKMNSDPRFLFGRALAVTCTEVFANVHAGKTSQIVRIRLDSLGPGTPPD